MVNPPQADASPPNRAEPVREKVRLRFRKGGDLRLLSHHDLLRCFERMLRRSGLPFRSTQGFNPHPRIVFPLSLSLGVVGHDEAVELEFDQPVSADEVRDRLAGQAPPGLEIRTARRIDFRVTGQARRAVYRLALPADAPPDLAARAAGLLAADECFVERARPQPRRLDVRPYLDDVCVTPDSVVLTVIVTPNGTARPDEVFGRLGLRDWLDAGAVVERTRLELHDEYTSSP